MSVTLQALILPSSPFPSPLRSTGCTVPPVPALRRHSRNLPRASCLTKRYKRPPLMLLPGLHKEPSRSRSEAESSFIWPSAPLLCTQLPLITALFEQVNSPPPHFSDTTEGVFVGALQLNIHSSTICSLSTFKQALLSQSACSCNIVHSRSPLTRVLNFIVSVWISGFVWMYGQLNEGLCAFFKCCCCPRGLLVFCRQILM